MTPGMRITAIALIALLAIGQPALGANRRLLSDSTSPVQLFKTSVSGLAEAADKLSGRLLLQVTGQRGAYIAHEPLAGETTRTGANAEPLAATNSGGLRSTTGGQSSGLATTTATAGTRPTGQVSVDSTESDAATTGNIRGVTNNAGTIGSGGQRPGEVSADVMPSATNQGGGVRPSQGALAMETMPESQSAMSMQAEP